MVRTARTIASGIPHHVTQRGNNRQNVFFSDNDKALYLTLLKKNSAYYGLQIWSYCLMDNHIHLIVVPKNRESLSVAIGKTNFTYTNHINKKYKRSGHLWQNRFFSCILAPMRCLTAMQYVERNPVRARIVKNAWEYPWSSAGANIIGEDSINILELKTSPASKIGPEQWKSMISDEDDDISLINLRKATRLGRAIGSKKFISELEILLGRSLENPLIGRPPKEKPYLEIH